LNEGEWVEPGGRRPEGGGADDAAASAVGVGEAVEQDGVASEAVGDEDLREKVRARGVEAQLDLAGQSCADLEQATFETDGAVLADGSPLAVEEHLVEGLLSGEGPQVQDVLEPMLSRGSTCRVVFTGVVLDAEPGVVLGDKLDQGDGLVRKLVLDLGAPGAVPSLDDTLRGGVPSLGMQQADAELGADGAERAGDVRRPAVDVVGAGAAVTEQGLLEAVLLADRALSLAEGEVAMTDIASGAVDLGKEADFAQPTVFGGGLNEIHLAAVLRSTSGRGHRASPATPSSTLDDHSGAVY